MPLKIKYSTTFPKYNNSYQIQFPISNSMTEISQRQLHSQEKPVKSKSLKSLKICKKTYWAHSSISWQTFPIEISLMLPHPQYQSINHKSERRVEHLLVLSCMSCPPDWGHSWYWQLPRYLWSGGHEESGMGDEGSQLEESVRRHKQSWKQLMLIETVRDPILVEKSLQ